MLAVEHIALQHNEFGDAGVHELAAGLRQNISVCIIELGSNNITNEGASAMATMLRGRQTFKRLFLDRNLIDDCEKYSFAGKFLLEKKFYM